MGIRSKKKELEQYYIYNRFASDIKKMSACCACICLFFSHNNDKLLKLRFYLEIGVLSFIKLIERGKSAPDHRIGEDLLLSYDKYESFSFLSSSDDE
jgi:hypothetical protein